MILQNKINQLTSISVLLLLLLSAVSAYAQPRVMSPDEKIYKGKIQSLQNYGDSAAAVTVANEYVSTIKNKYGTRHKEMAKALNALGHALFTDGRYEEAKGQYLQALGVEERLSGSSHPDLVAHLGGLVTVYYALLQFEEANRIKARIRKISDN